MVAQSANGHLPSLKYEDYPRALKVGARYQRNVTKN